jgi:hypothetical protein
VERLISFVRDLLQLRVRADHLPPANGPASVLNGDAVATEEDGAATLAIEQFQDPMVFSVIEQGVTGIEPAGEAILGSRDIPFLIAERSGRCGCP